MENLISKTLNYRGESTTVYFRELTAGEQAALLKGSTQVVSKGQTEVTVDLGAEHTRSTHLVALTLVTAEGKRVYPDLQTAQAEKGSKMKLLRALANEANREFYGEEQAAASGND